MAKNKVNGLLKKGHTVETVSSDGLEIVGGLNDEKLGKAGREEKVVVVLKDIDGKAYVIDGRHHTERAKRKGQPVRVVFVNEDELVGRQTALDRLIGMILRKK